MASAIIRISLCAVRHVDVNHRGRSAGLQSPNFPRDPVRQRLDFSSAMATLQPSAANASVIALPMLLPPPVTTTFLPFNPSSNGYGLQWCRSSRIFLNA